MNVYLPKTQGCVPTHIPVGSRPNYNEQPLVMFLDRILVTVAVWAFVLCLHGRLSAQDSYRGRIIAYVDTSKVVGQFLDQGLFGRDPSVVRIKPISIYPLTSRRIGAYEFESEWFRIRNGVNIDA